MPTYDYLELESGKTIERNVPMAEADNQPGLMRVFLKAPAVKVCIPPIASHLPFKEKIRQGYRRIENKGGRWSSSFKKDKLKKIWNI